MSVTYIPDTSSNGYMREQLALEAENDYANPYHKRHDEYEHADKLALSRRIQTIRARAISAIGELTKVYQ